MIKIKKFKVSGWGAASDKEINDFIKSVDILEFTTVLSGNPDLPDVSEPFMKVGNSIVFKYLEKDFYVSRAHRLEKLRMRVEQGLRSLQKACQDVQHAQMIINDPTRDEIKKSKDRETLAEGETMQRRIAFDYKIIKQLYEDALMYGFDHEGGVDYPVDTEVGK